MFYFFTKKVLKNFLGHINKFLGMKYHKGRHLKKKFVKKLFFFTMRPNLRNLNRVAEAVQIERRINYHKTWLQF